MKEKDIIIEVKQSGLHVMRRVDGTLCYTNKVNATHFTKQKEVRAIMDKLHVPGCIDLVWTDLNDRRPRKKVMV